MAAPPAQPEDSDWTPWYGNATWTRNEDDTTNEEVAGTSSSPSPALWMGDDMGPLPESVLREHMLQGEHKENKSFPLFLGGHADATSSNADSLTAGQEEAAVDYDAPPPPCTNQNLVVSLPGGAPADNHDDFLPPPCTNHFLPDDLLAQDGRENRHNVDGGVGTSADDSVNGYLVDEAPVPCTRHDMPPGISTIGSFSAASGFAVAGSRTSSPPPSDTWNLPVPCARTDTSHNSSTALQDHEHTRAPTGASVEPSEPPAIGSPRVQPYRSYAADPWAGDYGLPRSVGKEVDTLTETGHRFDSVADVAKSKIEIAPRDKQPTTVAKLEPKLDADDARGAEHGRGFGHSTFGHVIPAGAARHGVAAGGVPTRTNLQRQEAELLQTARGQQPPPPQPPNQERPGLQEVSALMHHMHLGSAGHSSSGGHSNFGYGYGLAGVGGGGGGAGGGTGAGTLDHQLRAQMQAQAQVQVQAHHAQGHAHAQAQLKHEDQQRAFQSFQQGRLAQQQVQQQAQQTNQSMSIGAYQQQSFSSQPRGQTLGHHVQTAANANAIQDEVQVAAQKAAQAQQQAAQAQVAAQLAAAQLAVAQLKQQQQQQQQSSSSPPPPTSHSQQMLAAAPWQGPSVGNALDSVGAPVTMPPGWHTGMTNEEQVRLLLKQYEAGNAASLSAIGTELSSAGAVEGMTGSAQGVDGAAPRKPRQRSNKTSKQRREGRKRAEMRRRLQAMEAAGMAVDGMSQGPSSKSGPGGGSSGGANPQHAATTTPGGR